MQRRSRPTLGGTLLRRCTKWLPAWCSHLLHLVAGVFEASSIP